MNAREDWQNDALCADHHAPDLFHPKPGGMTEEKRRQIRAAQDVCAPCPVKAECLAEAIQHDWTGIWGGTTEEQRNGMKAARPGFSRRPNQPTASDRCGTYSGAQRHRKLDERFCDGCRDAKNAYENDRKRRARAAARDEELSA